MNNVKGEFEYLSIDHSPSQTKWEEIPDEYLWEDGEINNQKELMAKIEQYVKMKLY